MSDTDNAMRIADTLHLVTRPKVPKAPELKHAGPIHSTVAGRTDHLPMQVADASYVLPADFVSHAGQNNTAAGFKVLQRVFGGNPYRGAEEPYEHKGGPYGMDQPMASGGKTKGVPIVAAGGEYVLTPEQVREIGGGDIARGHRVLDKFVLWVRQDLIKTLKHLAPPKKN